MSAASDLSGASASSGPGRVVEPVPGKQRTARKREQRSGEPAHAPVSGEPNSDAPDRDDLLDRLQSLRAIVPVLAHELGWAPRRTPARRRENSRLLERIREL